MRYNIFISYANPDIGIVENLRACFIRYGVNAWVYSRDSALAANIWDQIELKIIESDLLIFVVSENTPNAEGQKRELELMLEKVEPLSGTSKILPIFITGTKPSDWPEVLRNKKGEFLDEGNIKSVSWKIATSAFPSLVKNESEKPWKYPVPGEWFEVSSLDEIIEKYFDIGDKLYFRTISPMGLFECYAPKIKGLFWIAHEYVKSLNNIKLEKELEAEVPMIFRVSGMIEIQRWGWETWCENQVKNGN